MMLLAWVTLALAHVPELFVQHVGAYKASRVLSCCQLARSALAGQCCASVRGVDAVKSK